MTDLRKFPLKGGYFMRAPLTWVGDWLSSRYDAANGNTPAEVLKRPVLLWFMSFSSEDATRRNVLASKRLPLSVLRRLARDKDLRVREILAQSNQSTVKILAILAGDCGRNVRYFVASNANTSAEILGFLARDAHALVRQNVASNLNTPVEVLGLLLADENPLVRSRAAANSGFDDKSLRRIASYAGDPNIGWGVATNPNTPADVLAELVHGSSRVVTDAVLDRLFSLRDDEDFAALLRAFGCGEFVGLPRDWVRKTFGVDRG